MDAMTFNSFTVAERRKYLKSNWAAENVPDGIAEKLRESYAIGRIFSNFAKEFLELRLKVVDPNSIENLISQEISSFLPIVLRNLDRKISESVGVKSENGNLFKWAGAKRLAIANDTTRTISTSLGALWERIAGVSGRVVRPEADFGCKLAGVDVILLNCQTERVEFCQLKTTKNTLTGSQKGRTIAELPLFDRSAFCACFDTGATWSFNDKKIQRRAGAETWAPMGLEYGYISDKVKKMLVEIEDHYLRAIQKK